MTSSFFILDVSRDRRIFLVFYPTKDKLFEGIDLLIGNLKLL